MTDKEIIIDGVNVAKCGYIYFEIYEDFGNKEEVARCSIGNAFNNNRCENENCYFKQLQRKSQECEKINLINERLVKEKYDLNLQIDKLHQECEELKNNVEESLKIYDLVSQNKCYKQALEKIEEILTNTYCLTNFTCKETAEMAKKILTIINEVKNI